MSAAMRCLPLFIAAMIVAACAGDAAATETVYWRQNLFSIPYQWNSAGNPGSAKSVRLFVSRDRGATWQPISEAQPQLLSFNYRAEGDGEYWFAIRSADASGRDLSAAATGGSMQPELRVIVDTVMPRIESLTSQVLGDGTLEIRWRAVDANLADHSSSVDVQLDPTGPWQAVSLTSATETTAGTWDGQARLPMAGGGQPYAVRLTVHDLAGNRATYQSTVAPGVGGATAIAADLPLSSPTNRVDLDGWMPASAPAAPSAAIEPAIPQPWPADRAANVQPGAAIDAQASVTYGMPSAEADEVVGIPTPSTDDRPLGNVPAPRREPFSPIEPFRQVSTSHQSASAGVISPGALAAPPPLFSGPAPVNAPRESPTTKFVNSRTFALEYELTEIRDQGVARVTLWGTHDGGQSWQRYADDDDNRSPLTVTVDGEGLYGFKIVVEGADGLGGFPPQPGDVPELCVGIDLEGPQARVTSVTPEVGSAGPEVRIRWEAIDDNLESRPISLFYSSRAAGPWTPIATNMEDIGQYLWVVERHVPRHVYLRLEARDTAGNVAVFQTSERIAVEATPPMPHPQRLPPP